MTTNRRAVLGVAAASVALGVVPAWIRKAFAGQPPGRTVVFDAYRRARRTHRRLLIFVVPADPDGDLTASRAHVLGAFLTYATDAQLAPLARCEVVCATAARIHELVPDAPSGEPLALLVDTTGVPAKVSAIDVALDSWDHDDGVTANNDRIARALRDALGPADPALAASVRAALAERDLPGARWATSLECGVRFDRATAQERAHEVMTCGMASMPERSRRFLSWLAHPQAW